jgi:hypothetical protein
VSCITMEILTIIGCLYVINVFHEPKSVDTKRTQMIICEASRQRYVEVRHEIIDVG